MDRRDEMRRFLARRERAGLTFRALSSETGVPVGTLAFWAWKLRQEAVESAPSSETTGGFVELIARPEVLPEPSGSALEIVLAGDRRVVVRGAIDEAQLARVVRALERC